jgi:hypothetical protein
MSITSNRIVQAALWSVAAIAVVGAGALFWLIYPGTPTSGKSLDFKGFVLLPGTRTLNVLDYRFCQNIRHGASCAGSQAVALDRHRASRI